MAKKARKKSAPRTTNAHSAPNKDVAALVRKYQQLGKKTAVFPVNAVAKLL